MPIKSLGNPASKPEDDIKVQRRYLEQFGRISILDGQLVKGTMLAGQQTLLIRHSLGRPYVGGFIAGVSAPEAVMVLTPQVATQSGTDTALDLSVLSLSTVLSDTLISVWVF